MGNQKHVLGLTIVSLTMSIIGSVWADSDTIDLTAHLARYDLLVESREGRDPIGQGHLVVQWDVECHGYRMDQVMQFDLRNAEGQIFNNRNEFRYFEQIDGTKFTYSTRQYLNEKLVEELAGRAIRSSKGQIMLRHDRPKRADYLLGKDIKFPAAATLALIDLMQQDAGFYATSIFDGSKPDSAFRVSALKLADHHVATLSPRESAEFGLVDRQSWGLALSWFEENGHPGTDRLPDFTVKMRLYENGINSFMRYQYPGFLITASLETLDYTSPKACDE